MYPLVALDLGAASAVAVLSGPDALPRARTFTVGEVTKWPAGPERERQRFGRFTRHIVDMLAVERPARLYFEATIPRGKPARISDDGKLIGGDPPGMYAALQLPGYRALLYGCCFARGVDVREVNILTARKSFTGKGRWHYEDGTDASKDHVQHRCRELGWRFSTPDEADAYCVLGHALVELRQPLPRASAALIKAAAA